MDSKKLDIQHCMSSTVTQIFIAYINPVSSSDIQPLMMILALKASKVRLHLNLHLYPPLVRECSVVRFIFITFLFITFGLLISWYSYNYLLTTVDYVIILRPITESRCSNFHWFRYIYTCVGMLVIARTQCSLSVLAVAKFGGGGNCFWLCNKGTKPISPSISRTPLLSPSISRTACKSYGSLQVNRSGCEVNRSLY